MFEGDRYDDGYNYFENAFGTVFVYLSIGFLFAGFVVELVFKIGFDKLT